MNRFILSHPESPPVCFQHHAEYLCHYLSRAQRSIQAAVCWFSNRDIFDVLLARLLAGVHIELLVEYDTQNIRPEGLDFQYFIQKGGHFFAFREYGLMHHKFAIIDGRLLLTGSYNWTYNSNAENLLILHDSALIQSFQEEFTRLKSRAKRIFRVRQSDAKAFATFPIFENTQFPFSDLRKKVGCGTAVWTVKMDCMEKHYADIFIQQSLPFDAHGLLSSYWQAYRIWDESLFDEEIKHLLQTGISAPALRHLRCWARRMKIGDLVFAIEKRSNSLAGIGVIQSDPQCFEGEVYSSFRAVQWLKIMQEKPYCLPEKAPGQAVGRYRGSAFRVLQEVMGGSGGG